MIRALIPHIEKNDKVILTGSSSRLGKWNPELGIDLPNENHCYFYTDFTLSDNEQWKLVIIKDNRQFIWEEGENRISSPLGTVCFRYSDNNVSFFSFQDEAEPYNGGIGDFLSLCKHIRKTSSLGIREVFLPPLNDTCDNNPGNIISAFAINPLFLNMELMGMLNDVEAAHSIADKAQDIDYSDEIDWDETKRFKNEYFRAIYQQDGEETTRSREFLSFFQQERYWLLPYAVFKYLSDLNGTTDFDKWGEFSTYRISSIKKLLDEGSVSRKEILFHVFLQYHIQKQLNMVRETAIVNSVILSGEIPEGVVRNSPEVWRFPSLFKKDRLIGTAPDAKMIFGIKTKYSPYNWDKIMENDSEGRIWWKYRLQKAETIYDTLRLNNKYAFYNTWEIPTDYYTSVKGHFSPCIGYTSRKIRESGFDFNEKRDILPILTREYIYQTLGEDFRRFAEFFKLTPTGEMRFKPQFENTNNLNDYFSQRKYNNQEITLKNKLIQLSEESLFVRISHNCFQPRIAGQYTHGYKILSDKAKDCYNKLYDAFYYGRDNNNLWSKTGTERIEMLIKSTRLRIDFLA